MYNIKYVLNVILTTVDVAIFVKYLETESCATRHMRSVQKRRSKIEQTNLFYCQQQATNPKLDNNAQI